VTDARQPRCGVLLAGGAGVRFGGAAKGLLPLGDARLADGPLRVLSALCDEVLVAANDADAESWFPGHRVVRDRVPGLGALGALETALQAANGRNVLVCAWDMPFITERLLAQLIAIVEHGASCCVPVHTNGRLDPLCAAYGIQCATVASGMIARGERAAHKFANACGGHDWPIDVAMSPAEAQRAFFNVNTPDDLRRAELWLLPQPIRSS
jgi:molybdopterin-guanine dinucleotide biosynthesis protein A